MLRDFINKYIKWYASSSKSVSKSLAHSSQLRIYLAWRTSKNQTAYRISSELYIVKTPKDVYFTVCYNYSWPCCILNCILGLSFFSTNSTNASAQMITMKCFHILDFKSLQIEIIKSQYSNGVLEFKTQHKGFQEICRFLNCSYIFCFVWSLFTG